MQINLGVRTTLWRIELVSIEFKEPLNTFESREHSDKVTNSISLASDVLKIIGFYTEYFSNIHDLFFESCSFNMKHYKLIEIC